MAYLDTPRTDAGNQTYLSDVHDVQIENSFISPLKKKEDINLRLPNSRGLSIRTPRARQPLAPRHKIAQAQAEFTPLLKSPAKGNHSRKGKVIAQTPSSSEGCRESPLSRAISGSAYYGDDQNSFARDASDSTSVVQMLDSSAQSTPLAMPSKDSKSILVDQGNKFTLKEHENMLDKVEKENFGLKLKIHFFEKMLQSADAGFDEAAVKENMDLKVDKVTMQRELARTRKTLLIAEQEVETYRQQIEEAQEKVKRHVSDENVQKELDELRRELGSAYKDNETLRSHGKSLQEQHQAKFKLEEDIENLEAELRERDLRLDSKEDEIDDLKEQVSQDLQIIADLEEDLESRKQQMAEMHKIHDDSEDLKKRLKQSEDRAATAMEQKEAMLLGKQKAEDALHEFQMQIADKSFNSKGLDRQLEERIRQLLTELDQLHAINSTLQRTCNQEAQNVQILEEEIRDLKEQIESKDQNHREKSNMLERERDLAVQRECGLKSQLQKALEDTERHFEGKDILQRRYDALTTNMQQLQKESSKVKVELADAEKLIALRQELLVENQSLKNEAKEELLSLTREMTELKTQLQCVWNESSVNKEKWKMERRDLELQKDGFETRALSLQDTIERLQASTEAKSNSEAKLQETLATEKQRFKYEETALNRHIRQLQKNLDEKDYALENAQSKLTSGQKKLTSLEQSQALYEGRIQELEDEIEVLQCSLEERNDARRDVQAITTSSKDQLHEPKWCTRNDQESDMAFENKVSKLSSDSERVQHEKASLADRLARAQNQLETFNEMRESKMHGPVTNELELRAEVIRLQRKLLEAGEHNAKLRAEMRECEATCEQKLLVSEGKSKTTITQHEQSQKRLRRDLSGVHTQLRKTEKKNKELEEICETLRREMQALESTLANSQVSKADGITMAVERKDLHELLKTAKLEAEDLQTRLQEREADVQHTISERNSLRCQIDRVQEDRTKEKHQVAALLSELEMLQRRYDISIENLGKKQRDWEEERKAITSKVQFLNTSVSSVQAGEHSLLHSVKAEKREAEERHAAEIRGLTKQISWMKAKQSREEGFRAGLIFEKKFLLLQVEMFNACNALDLRLLEGMGVALERKSTKSKPTMKIAAIMVLAGLRMQRLQRCWAGQKKVQASLAKRVVQMRRPNMISK